jgi:hypothetical protein
MIKRINKIRIFYILFFIIIANTPLAFGLIEVFFFQDNPYNYSNADGTFTVEVVSGFKSNPECSYHYLSLYKSYQDGAEPIGKRLRKDYPNADTVVYRLFWKNPLCFWRWYWYLTDELEQYNFPYKSWNEIKKRRPKNFKRMEKWQDF